jgi:hypothetical protein
MCRPRLFPKGGCVVAWDEVAFFAAQRELGRVLELNVPSRHEPHVVVALPSFSVGETLLSHYADRIPALEHRYLVALFLLNRLPGARLVFVASQRPSDAVIDDYFAMMNPAVVDDARGRFEIITVDDASARAVAAKLLGSEAALSSLRDAIGDLPAVIEPWNVDRDEATLAAVLGIPINGADPTLRALGFKSAGRKLLMQAGVPVPFGVENVASPDGVVEAARAIYDARPDTSGIVVKLDDSGAGDGNVVIRSDSLPTEPSARLAALRDVVGTLPDWYLHDLTRGAVVEERISGNEFSSPSAQIDMKPDGSVIVLSTHEQELGGEDATVYLGCRFPARRDYAPTLARHANAIGQELVSRGAVGRAGIDFVAARTGPLWEIAAIEINLRKGGTTHPYTALRHLTGGRYDPATGQWLLPDGSTRVYIASDNFLEDGWQSLTEEVAVGAIRNAGLSFKPANKVGVVLHMLSCLGIDGRCGIIAIAHTADEAESLRSQARAALNAAANS